MVSSTAVVLASWPPTQARMDENFMLMSRDVAFVLAAGFVATWSRPPAPRAPPAGVLPSSAHHPPPPPPHYSHHYPRPHPPPRPPLPPFLWPLLGSSHTQSELLVVNDPCVCVMCAYSSVFMCVCVCVCFGGAGGATTCYPSDSRCPSTSSLATCRCAPRRARVF
jgi:hypothetical protein